MTKLSNETPREPNFHGNWESEQGYYTSVFGVWYGGMQQPFEQSQGLELSTLNKEHHNKKKAMAQG